MEQISKRSPGPFLPAFHHPNSMRHLLKNRHSRRLGKRFGIPELVVKRLD